MRKLRDSIKLETPDREEGRKERERKSLAFNLFNKCANMIKVKKIFGHPYKRHRNRMGKEGSYYFPHDYNARSDDGTAALISQYGAQGYGIYWIIAEILHESPESRIEYNDKKLKRIAGPAKVEFELFKGIIDDCLNTYELFELKDGFIISKRVVRNKDKRQEIKSKRSEAGKRGAAIKWQMPSESMANAIKNDGKGWQTIANDSKGKESKVNNTTTEVVAVVPFLPMEDLKILVLEDQKFVEQFFRIGVDPEILPGWLDAFHRRLEFDKETIKTEKDYRRHFANWIPKIKYRSMKPEDYSPVNEPPKETHEPTHTKAADPAAVAKKYG